MLRQSNAIEEIFDADSLGQALIAWDYLMQQKELDAHVILKTHKILMLNQPLRPDERGYFRRIQVGVNTPAGFLEKMQWERIPGAIEQWCKNANMTTTNEWAEDLMAEEIRNDHVAYENIHPFVDGNGRTGRMFMNWQRIKAGLPILILKREERSEYYKWFK